MQNNFEGIVYPQEDKQFFEEQNKYNEKFEIKEYKEVFKEKVACAVQQWIEVKNRVQEEIESRIKKSCIETPMGRHHVMGDTLSECFTELYQEESNIIKFPKK